MVVVVLVVVVVVVVVVVACCILMMVCCVSCFIGWWVCKKPDRTVLKSMHSGLSRRYTSATMLHFSRVHATLYVTMSAHPHETDAAVYTA